MCSVYTIKLMIGKLFTSRISSSRCRFYLYLLYNFVLFVLNIILLTHKLGILQTVGHPRSFIYPPPSEYLNKFLKTWIKQVFDYSLSFRLNI